LSTIPTFHGGCNHHQIEKHYNNKGIHTWGKVGYLAKQGPCIG
jgi:hypothetical protein